jgi:hypothetical protein
MTGPMCDTCRSRPVLIAGLDCIVCGPQPCPVCGRTTVPDPVEPCDDCAAAWAAEIEGVLT